MAELDYATTDVATAGTAAQLSTSTRKATAMHFQAPWGNTGLVYIGKSDVSSTKRMHELQPGEWWDYEVRAGASVDLDIWYVDADTNGDDLNWVAELL